MKKLFAHSASKRLLSSHSASERRDLNNPTLSRRAARPLRSVGLPTPPIFSSVPEARYLTPANLSQIILN